MDNNNIAKLKFLHLMIVFMRPFFSVVFEQKYLHGRYFDNSILGWKWAWQGFIWQKIFGFNRNVPWPTAPYVKIDWHNNIIFDPDDINNFQMYGVFFLAASKITIGKGTYIGPNVGIITMNHDLLDPDKFQEPEEVRIGKCCWIGMNSVLMPGVVLGDQTVVGTGSIVTRPFPEGYAVIAGNPAKVIRNLGNPDSN